MGVSSHLYGKRMIGPERLSFVTAPMSPVVLSPPYMDIDHHISRTLEGDTRAYAEVVRMYQHMVYTVCHRVLRNAEDAEEATQDTFVKAYQNLGGWSRTAKFSTWLYSIAYRTAVSHGRRRKHTNISVDELAHDPEAQEDATNERLDMKHHVDQALAVLSPEDASILSFFYLEEMSIDEIVTVTGLGASNVKVKLHRGRKKMLAVLNADLKGEARSLLMEDA